VLWLSCVGTSDCAVLNSIWAALDQGHYALSALGLLWTPRARDERIQKAMDTVRHVLRVLLAEMGLEPVSVYPLEFDEEKPSSFIRAAQQAFTLARDHDLKVVVDITAGRKYMSAYLLGLALRRPDQVLNVVYTHLLDQRYMNALYPLVPAPAHELALDVSDLLVGGEPE